MKKFERFYIKNDRPVLTIRIDYIYDNKTKSISMFDRWDNDYENVIKALKNKNK